MKVYREEAWGQGGMGTGNRGEAWGQGTEPENEGGEMFCCFRKLIQSFNKQLLNASNQPGTSE